MFASDNPARITELITYWLDNEFPKYSLTGNRYVEFDSIFVYFNGKRLGFMLVHKSKKRNGQVTLIKNGLQGKR